MTKTLETVGQRKETGGSVVGKRPVLIPPTARSLESERMSTNDPDGSESSGLERPWQDEDILRENYVIKDYTTYDLAEMWGCEPPTISRWLSRFEIETGPAGNGTPDELKDESMLERWYVADGLTSYEIADRVGCSRPTVTNWLRRHGIEIRDAAEIQKETVGEDARDAETLRHLYIDRGLTAREVAAELRTTKPTVIKYLRLNGIEVRPPKARDISGENHPRWDPDKIRKYGPNWQEQREKRIEKDRGECSVCGMGRGEHKEKYGWDITVHHIIPRSSFVEDGVFDYERANRVDNLVTLCKKHHGSWEGIPLRPDNRGWGDDV